MVEERHPNFQADGHAGAVHLGQDVVGQIANGVQDLHALHRIVESRRRGRGRLVSAKYQPAGVDARSGEMAIGLGLVVEGQTVSAFETALFALEPGGLSDVVETPFGFHVIQMVERQADRVVPFEQASGPIRDLLLQQEQQAQTTAFIDELKAKHDVRILLGTAAPRAAVPIERAGSGGKTHRSP